MSASTSAVDAAAAVSPTENVPSEICVMLEVAYIFQWRVVDALQDVFNCIGVNAPDRLGIPSVGSRQALRRDIGPFLKGDSVNRKDEYWTDLEGKLEVVRTWKWLGIPVQSGDRFSPLVDHLTGLRLVLGGPTRFDSFLKEADQFMKALTDAHTGLMSKVQSDGYRDIVILVVDVFTHVSELLGDGLKDLIIGDLLVRLPGEAGEHRVQAKSESEFDKLAERFRDVVVDKVEFLVVFLEKQLRKLGHAASVASGVED